MMLFKMCLPIGVIVTVVSEVAVQADDAAPINPNIVILFSDDTGYADFGFQPNCAGLGTPDRVGEERTIKSELSKINSTCITTARIYFFD